MNLEDLEDKRIAILGYGVEGKAEADFLRGRKLEFDILDQTISGDYLANLSQYDVVIRSPGVKPHLPELEAFIANGGIVETQMRLFFANYPHRKRIIGITGTKGKGTTALLLQAILERANLPVRLGGNIGSGAFELLSPEVVNEDPWIILELSSFQLQHLQHSPHLAVVLMITSDHLDYHRSLDEYVQAKAAITAFQESDDVAVYNVDYPESERIGMMGLGRKLAFSTVTAAAVGDDGAVALREEDMIYLIRGGEKIPLGRISDLQLRGYHNTQNVCAAAAAAAQLGIDPETIWHACTAFAGYAHRLQFVTERGGVKFYDDSIATVPESALTAAAAFTEPTIIFAGGSDKGEDYVQFGKDLAGLHHIKAVCCVGLIGGRIAAGLQAGKFTGKIIAPITADKSAYDECFAAIAAIAKDGDVVLLAPGTSSFDMFSNYKERGDYFAALAGR